MELAISSTAGGHPGRSRRGRPAPSGRRGARRLVLCTGLCVPLLLGGRGVAAPPAEPPLTLEALLREVSQRAPALLVRAEAEGVAAARVGVEGALEDPSVEVMAESVPLRGGPEAPEAMYTYRFTQPLGVLWRRGPAKRAARSRVEAERARTRRVDWDVRAQATAGFWELWMNGEMHALLERQLALLERMRQSARARYAAGQMMGHHDVLRAEAEAATMRAELAGLESERRAVTAMLNALRGQPPEARLGLPEPPPRVPLPALADVVARGGARPELAEARAMQAEMAAQRTLAGRMALPMPMVAGFYEHRPGEMPDSVGGAVGLTVPLWWFDRQRHEVRMAEAEVRRAQRDREAMEAMTRAELEMAWSRAHAADARLEALEQGALPRLRETVRSAEAAYVGGTGDFLALLEAGMAQLRVESEGLAARAQRETARFELERLLGAPLDGAGPEVSP